ncbi:MAG: methyltransferase [Methanomicrobiaceae archaeon]|nr:methyltransferase [Methanomicrobiaceae archaeon]MDD5419975.1 methyltransferase [Methanomicrobiaceae archaeon]
MRARKVALCDLASVADEEWVDRSRRPYVAGSDAWVPAKDGYPADAILPERRRRGGRGYQMIGDIAVLHGAAPAPEEVAAIVAERRPRGVLLLRGFSGDMRIPEVEVLYGSAGEVRHREQGCTYVLDPSRVMFAQGNRVEKARIAALVRPEERIADMCAGIGYFSIPAARSGGRVHAMEINPIAFEYLKRTILANRVEDRVQADCGDCRTLLSGEYDRVIIGHFDAVGMLRPALRHVRPGSVLHVHSLGPAADGIRAIAKEAGYTADISARRVKKYGPHTWHMVQDVILA